MIALEWNISCYVGDSSYYDGGQWAKTPTGQNNAEQKMIALEWNISLIVPNFKCDYTDVRHS